MYEQCTECVNNVHICLVDSRNVQELVDQLETRGSLRGVRLSLRELSTLWRAFISNESKRAPKNSQRIEESTEEQRAGAGRRGRRRAARERPLVASRSLLPPPTGTECPPRRSAAEAKRSLETCKLILSSSKYCTMYQVNTVPVRTNAGFSALPTSVKMVVTLRALTDSGWSETS